MKIARPIRLLATVLSAGLLMTAPVSAAASEADLLLRLTGDPEIAAELDESDVVRQLYERVEALLTGSSHDVSIEISNVGTIFAERFIDHDWKRLVTIEGPRLQLERVDLSVPSTKAEWVHVKATWQEEAPTSAPPMKQSARFTVADAAALFDEPGTFDQHRVLTGKGMERLPATHRETLSTLALTSYVVHLRNGDRSLNYRAAIFWREHDDGSIELSIQDNVLTPVDLIAFETREPTPYGDLESLLAAHPDLLAEPSFPSKAQCLFTDIDRTFPSRTRSGKEDHGGRFAPAGEEHASILKVKVRDSCSGSCFARCTPTIQTDLCYDTGIALNPTRRHKAYKVSSATFGSGHMSANCGAAIQCAFKSCTVGFCGSGLGVSLSWNGASFSFGNPSNALVTYNTQETSSAGCAELPPPPPPPPDDDCVAGRTQVVVLPIDDDAPTIRMPENTFTLKRAEPSAMVHMGQPVAYVMGEWALVGLTPPGAEKAPRVDFKRVSSARFGLAKKAPITESLATLPSKQGAVGSSTALIVEHPAHDDNSRAIPLPDLRLEPIERDANAETGRILVRADFGEARTLSDFEILYDQLGVDETLRARIREQLSLSYRDDREHRVVAFAVIEVGEKVEIVRSMRYLPKCCCGGEFCI